MANGQHPEVLHAISLAASGLLAGVGAYNATTGLDRHDTGRTAWGAIELAVGGIGLYEAQTNRSFGSTLRRATGGRSRSRGGSHTGGVTSHNRRSRYRGH